MGRVLSGELRNRQAEIVQSGALTGFGPEKGKWKKAARKPPSLRPVQSAISLGDLA